MSPTREHVVSSRTYIAVLIALMVLLALTVVAAFINLDKLLNPSSNGQGYWNMIVALLIAVCKAILIILIFMHVRYGSKLVLAFAFAAFFWLGIMITLSMSDYVTRGLPPSGTNVQLEIRPPPN